MTKTFTRVTSTRIVGARRRARRRRVGNLQGALEVVDQLILTRTQGAAILMSLPPSWRKSMHTEVSLKTKRKRIHPPVRLEKLRSKQTMMMTSEKMILLGTGRALRLWQLRTLLAMCTW